MSQGADGVQAPVYRAQQPGRAIAESRARRTAQGCSARRLIALYGVACLVACAVIAIAGAVTAWLAA